MKLYCEFEKEVVLFDGQPSLERNVNKNVIKASQSKEAQTAVAIQMFQSHQSVESHTTNPTHFINFYYTFRMKKENVRDSLDTLWSEFSVRVGAASKPNNGVGRRQVTIIGSQKQRSRDSLRRADRRSFGEKSVMFREGRPSQLEATPPNNSVKNCFEIKEFLS